MQPRHTEPSDEATRISRARPTADQHPPPRAEQVRLAEEAIRIVMRERAIDAAAAAEVIQQQAAQHHVTIREITETIVDLRRHARRGFVVVR